MLLERKSLDDGRCEITVDGDLTIYEANELKDGLVASLGAHREITVDLARVAEADTAGIQVLVALKRAALRDGKRLVLANHSTAVVEVLDLYNLSGFFGDPVVLSEHREQPEGAQP